MISNLDGILTLKKIRQLEAQHGVKEHAKSKVIMTSGNTDKDVILKAAQAGCTSFMIKSVDKKRLHNEIRKHGLDTPE